MMRMVDVDGFIQEEQKLTAEHRVKEAIDFADENNTPKNFRQFRVLCMYNAAGLWLTDAGDSAKSREGMLGMIRFMEDDMSIITEVPSLQEVMEDMYIQACQSVCDLAISYEEYEQHMVKIETVRPHTPLQKGQVELIQNMKNEGQPWLTNILLLAERYVGKDGGDRYGNAAGLYQLVLENRRLLRPSRAELKVAANNYGAFMFNLVQTHLTYCHTTRTPCNPNNYLFMLDKAIAVLEESKRDVGDPQMTGAAIADLDRTRGKLLDMQQKAESSGYDYTHPSFSGNMNIETSMPQLNTDRVSDFPSFSPGSNDEEEQMMRKATNGMRAIWLVVGILLAVLAAYLWYSGITLPDGKWWRILLAIICTFAAVGNFSAFGGSRKRR